MTDRQLYEIESFKRADSLPRVGAFTVYEAVVVPVTEKLSTRAEWEATIDHEAAAIRLWYRDNPHGGKFRHASKPEQHWTRYDAKEIVNTALGKPAIDAAVGEETP